ncbi:hypothetical protein [Rhodopseudomonas palustris]|uniref:Secreted protein n=1 Tax=Rhodopseudomonas palustris TaxID=1076 RepID=A0A418V188_RHOPL|nr:hypothetical protein [Rhodopseudomonas palustris]RJF69606.1 hypothetical protein D4Q52_19830 [Rhodopseudomonas palustris]
MVATKLATLIFAMATYSIAAMAAPLSAGSTGCGQAADCPSPEWQKAGGSGGALADVEQGIRRCIDQHQSEFRMPYGRSFTSIMDSCRSEIDHYARICSADGREPTLCKLDSVKYASSLLKQHPIDKSFADCLVRSAASVPPTDTSALTEDLCREEIRAFVTDCLTRHAAPVCQAAVADVAEAARQLAAK